MSTQPFEFATWPLEIGKTAVVNIDPQNDFLHADGVYAKNGIDISHMQRTIAPTKRLMDALRVKGVPIIWTRHGSKAGFDAGPFYALRPFLKDEGLLQNTWGYEVLAELEAQEDDWYIEKTRLSAFFQTNLEAVLRSLGVETVLLTGVLTNQCVGATTKDAMFRDFKPIVVEDCVGTSYPKLHDPIIEAIKVGWGSVRSLDEVLEELAAFPDA